MKDQLERELNNLRKKLEEEFELFKAKTEESRAALDATLTSEQQARTLAETETKALQQKLELATVDLEGLSIDRNTLRDSVSSLEHALRQTEEERDVATRKLQERAKASSSTDSLIEELRTQLRKRSAQLQAAKQQLGTLAAENRTRGHQLDTAKEQVERCAIFGILVMENVRSTTHRASSANSRTPREC